VAVLLCVLVMHSSALSAPKHKILVVLSGGEAPYLQAKEAIEQLLASEGCEVSAVQNDTITKPPTNYDGYIGVGTKAAANLQGKVPSSKPLVYCMVANPAAAGLEDMSGVSTDVSLRAQFELIGKALPRARTLGALCHPESVIGPDEIQAAAPENWRIETVMVTECDSTADAIAQLMGRNVDVVWTAADSRVYTAAAVRSLLLESLRRKVPVFGFSASFVRAGALIGTGINPADQGRQAGELISRMLSGNSTSGESPQSIEPEYEIAVNKIVAESLSVSIPDDVMRRADVVFEGGAD
jgi:ABC-type uncharacterized transport system substrate-binding protein